MPDSSPAGCAAFVLESLVSLGLVLVVVQFAVTAHSGIVNGRSWDQRLTVGARLVVNLGEIPAREHGCYAFYGVFVYLYPVPGVFQYSGFTEAEKDRLSVFSAGLLETIPSRRTTVHRSVQAALNEADQYATAGGFSTRL